MADNFSRCKMKNVLIAFSGKAQSGKTTSANILKELILDIQYKQLKNDPNIEAVSKQGDSFSIVEKNTTAQGRVFESPHVQIHSFATALKEIAVKYFGWDGDKGIYYVDTADSGAVDIHGDGQTDAIGSLPIPDKGRQLLINIGQVFRGIRPTIWVDYVVNNIKKSSNNLKDKGIVYLIDDMRFRNEIKLCKTFEPCFTVRISRPEELHIKDTSEMDLDNETFDYVLANNGDMEELKNELKKIYDDMLSKI